MRRFVVVIKIAIQTGRVSRYGRGGNVSSLNLTNMGKREFGLTHDQIRVCKARALEMLEEIDRLDRARPRFKKPSRRYKWEYLDKAA